MKRIIACLLIVVMLFGFASCATNKKTKGSENIKEENPWDDIELPEDEVILVSSYSNYAWGFIYEGKFVTGSGDVYKFDFSEMSPRELDEDAEFKKIIENNKPKDHVNMNALKEIYYYSTKMDPEAEWDVVHEACDYGENAISVYVEDKGLVTVYMQGDNTGSRDDKYAKKIKKAFDKRLFEDED